MISPANKVKQEIINLTRMWNEEPEVNFSTNEEIEELYDEMLDQDMLWDAISEIRCGEHETEVPCDYSRHYESKSVAMKCVDNSWVGWTYWYYGLQVGLDHPARTNVGAVKAGYQAKRGYCYDC